MTTTKLVEVLGIHIDPVSGDAIVLLGQRNEVTHVLPIFVGPSEARSIMVALAGLESPRPGTHDLMLEVLGLAGIELPGVVVTDLIDGTFHAELEVITSEGTKQVSCRPSDGIALILRVDGVIAVDSVVFDNAAVEVAHEHDESFTEEEIEAIVGEFQEYLENADPTDFAIEAGEEE